MPAEYISNFVFAQNIIQNIHGTSLEVIPFFIANGTNNFEKQEHLEYIQVVDDNQSNGACLNPLSKKLTTSNNSNGVIINSNFIGSFYSHNILASIVCLLSMKIKLSDLSNIFPKLNRVPGRMEVFQHNDKATIIIDFAHNTDRIKKCFSSIKNLAKNSKIHITCRATDAASISYNKLLAKLRECG